MDFSKSDIVPTGFASISPSYQQRLVAISETVKQDVILAQKRSVETALTEAQIFSDRELKRLRLENQLVDANNAGLKTQLKNLERRFNDLTETNEALRKQLEGSTMNACSRIDSILDSHKHEEMLTEKFDEMNANMAKLTRELESKMAEIVDLQNSVASLRAELSISERKRDDLQRLCEENDASLKETEALRIKTNELESANAYLTDQLEKAMHAPGNSSSLLSRPDGSGLFLRSSSILHTTRLEQCIAKLKIENAELRASEAQLVTTRAQLDDLNSKFQRAIEWRERAILAEEKLASQNASCLMENSEKRSALAQCQRENALLLSELGQLKSELMPASVELKSLKSELSVLTKEKRRLQTTLDCFESRFRRLNRRGKILQQERDMYKQFVNCYEDADATLASPAGELVHQFQEMVESISETLKMFHQQAEFDDAELKKLIDEIAFISRNDNASSIADASSVDLAISSGDRQTIQQLRETICELEERLEKAESAKQASEKEIEILRSCGAYNPDETQVLHFLANPADTAKRNKEGEIVCLRKENAQLQKRVNILQDRLTRLYESRDQGGDPGPNSAPTDVTMAVVEGLKDHPDPLLEIEKLKSQLQKERWRGDRLMETFASASSEYREACALLFGYNLYIRQSGIFKVQLRPSPSVSPSSTSQFIKFKRSGVGLVVMETTLQGEDAREFLKPRLPIPLALARLLLLKSGMSNVGGVDELTMLM